MQLLFNKIFMSFNIKKLKFLYNYDSITKYNLFHLKKNNKLNSIVLELPIGKLERYSRKFIKGSYLNTQIKAALYFYLFISKYSYCNFKSTKTSAGFCFKVVLRSFISISLFLISLFIEDQLAINFNKNKKLFFNFYKNDFFSVSTLLKGEFFVLNTELFKINYKDIKLKNFVVTINFNFKKTVFFKQTKNFTKNQLFFWSTSLI